MKGEADENIKNLLLLNLITLTKILFLIKLFKCLHVKYQRPVH